MHLPRTDTKKAAASSRPGLSLSVGLAALALALTGTSCFNNKLDRRLAGGSGSNGVESSNPFEGSEGTSSPSIVRLTRVVKSNSDPAGSLDLVGDGTGSIGNFCHSKDGESTGAGTGESTCQCAFKYDSGGTIPVLKDTTYFESNLIRCPYGDIPDTVSELEVSIYVVNIQQNSNSVTFNLYADPDSLDLSDSNSFLEVERYQCRDYITIPYMFANSADLYDPLQSEHILYSYPLNFYTTNRGGAISAFAELSGTAPDFYSKWDCYFNKWDRPKWQNLNIYSQDPYEGSKLIHPHQDGQYNRSEFFVARRPAGIMDIPLNGYIAPGIVTTSPDPQGNQQVGAGTYPPIGYGAAPTASEACPSTVEIPDDFQWVKVWLFRADLPPRTYVKTTEEIKYKYPQVACNTDYYTDDHRSDSDIDLDADSYACGDLSHAVNTLNVTPFPDCMVFNKSGIASLSSMNACGVSQWGNICPLQEVNNGVTGYSACNGLAARVLLNGVVTGKDICVLPAFDNADLASPFMNDAFTQNSDGFTPGAAAIIDDDVSNGPVPSANNPAADIRHPITNNPLNLGADIWMRPRDSDNHTPAGDDAVPDVADIAVHDTNAGEPPDANHFHFNLMDGVDGDAGVYFNDGALAVPYDDDVFGGYYLDQLEDESRADFLFVVTPPDVTRADMIDETGTVRRKYVPMTYKNPFPEWGGCDQDDPDASADCTNSKVTRFKLQLQPVGSVATAKEEFPLCVLQRKPEQN